MTQAELNTTLTPDEESLGYKKVWIENPLCRFGGHPFGEPHLLEGVAYEVSESVWVFKVNKPGGGVVYSEMQYGTAGISEHAAPNWDSVREATGDPAAAIQAAKLPRQRERQPAIPPRIEGSGNDRRILYSASQVRPADIQKHGGKAAGNWVEFPVKE